VVDRQASHAGPASLDHDHTPAHEIRREPLEDRKQQHELPFWAASGPATEQDERGACDVILGEQDREVCVGGHEHATFDSSQGENLTVRRGVETYIPHVRRIVPRTAQTLGQTR
jgi:hypothetical protein